MFKKDIYQLWYLYIPCIYQMYTMYIPNVYHVYTKTKKNDTYKNSTGTACLATFKKSGTEFPYALFHKK